jgi:sigma-B regulation protein RsbU (phosphoserine phosphatase)
MEEHSGLYFTLWYGVYETDTRRLHFGSAGHPPALLLSGGGGGEQRLITPNLPIGMVPGAPFRSQEIEVPTGARLFLYSDGAYEVVTRDGEEWSLDGFLGLVAGAASGPLDGEPARIEEGVRATMRADAFDDDFSLVIVDFA